MLIAATGHRPNKLGGYGPAAYRKLVTLAEAYLRLAKPEGIISGMALGWDQAWADAGLNLGIPVHAAVPFAGQESRWPLESQKNFKRIIDQCATVTIVCKGAYSAAKMQTRNEWMVDKADRVCALWDGSSGGTGNCLRYAQSADKQIDNVWQYLDSPEKLQAIAINPLDIPCAALYDSQHAQPKGICNMSIEALIREQIEALKENTAAVLLLQASLVGRAGGNSKPAKEEKVPSEKTARALEEAKQIRENHAAQEASVEEPNTAVVVTDENGEAVVEEPATETPALTYDNLRDLVLLLAKSGKREEIKSTFASHGIESGKDLLEKADDPASVKDHKKLAEVYADMKKLVG